MDFNLRTATADGTDALIVEVEGELDHSTAERLTEPIRLAVDAGGPMILDLSGCPFMDSSGLRLVLRAHHALSDIGSAVVVVAASPEVRKLFSITAIDLSIRIFPDRDRAIEWLGASGAKGARQRLLRAAPNGGPTLLPQQ